MDTFHPKRAYPMIRLSFQSFVLCTLLFGMSFRTHAGEPTGKLASFAASRTWSDATGKFKIEGKLKFADSNEVQIAQTNGKPVKIKIDGLSTADQTFVKSFLEAEAKASSEGDDDNPFKVVGEAPKGGMNSGAGKGSSKSSSQSVVVPATDASEPEKRQPIVKGAKLIASKLDKAFWAAKPALGFPEITFEEFAVVTDLKKSFHSGQRILTAGKAGISVIGSYQEGKEGYSRFAVVRASDSSVMDTIEYKTPWKLMAISSDGSRIAAVRIEAWDKGNDVGIFKVTKTGIVPDFQFTAGGGSWDELHFVGFAASNKLITISQKHNLVVWDISAEKPKALFQGNSGGALSAELSPAGELMALPAGNAIAVIDIATAKVVGLIERDNRALQIAFSSDGTKLAAYQPFSVTIYNMETGKELNRLAVSDFDPNVPLNWLGSYIMVGSVVYDVDRSLPLWTYENKATARSCLGSYLFCAFGGDKGTNVAVNRIPHEQAIQAASTIDPESIYAIRPGDSVAIEYNFGTAPSDAQMAIRNTVEEKVRNQGWKISNTASNTILVELEQGKQETEEYYTREGFGPFLPPPGFGPRPSGPLESVTFTPWTHKITIQCGANQVFQAVHVRGAPDNFRTKDGESTQAYVTRHCQPSPSYFQTLQIPPHILKPEFKGGLGKSVISGNGLGN